MLMKFCPQCRAAMNIGKQYCDTCQPIMEAKRQEAIEHYKKKANKKYDKQRDPKYRVFYRSQEWRRLSQYIISHAGYQCQDCKARGVVTVATEVHHINPIQTTDGWERRLDQSNLIALCASCHNKRHKRFGGKAPGDGKKV